MFAVYRHMTKAPFSTVHTAYIVTAALMLASTGATAQTTSRAQREIATRTQSTVPDEQQTLSVQVALDRAGFSPGEIDGRAGSKTRVALSTFQKSSNLQTSGTVTEETLAALRVSPEPLVSYTITQQDVAGPFIDKMPRDMMDASKLPALGYTSALEALSEKFHSSPALLQKLNPAATWAAGSAIRVPDIEPFQLPSKADKPTAAAGAIEVIVSGTTKSLIVRDAAGKTLMHAPVTVGSVKDPVPIGAWKVVGVSWNPVFNYNPDLFWDADPKHAKAKIPAGPNNPVGVVWVDINKQHFGLHGTPEPSTIGRTESHGCIRLTNWDATKLGRLVSVGTKVTIQ
jgi:lipoprotein-anchoring transpeptidase ErfK/SrfK